MSRYPLAGRSEPDRREGSEQASGGAASSDPDGGGGMTGRDVPTRQKSLSVAFSVIMVLSMMAIGTAGFAGSAAAFQDPVENPDPGANEEQTIFSDSGGSVIADNATSGENSTHTIVAQTHSGTNLEHISADSDTNQLRINVSYPGGFAVDGLSAGDVQVFIDGTEADVSGAGGISIGPDDQRLNITTDSGDRGADGTDLSNFDGTAGINVTVVLGSDLVENAADGRYNVSFQAFTSTSGSDLLAKHYSDFTPRKLQEVYDDAELAVLV